MEDGRAETDPESSVEICVQGVYRHGGALVDTCVEPRVIDDVKAPMSLEEAYRAHGTLLFRYAVALVGSEGDAEDALHTVFLRLTGKGLNGVRDVRAYLVGAVRNECVSRGRSRRRHKTLPLVEDIPERGSGRAAEVNHALVQIAGDLREIVILRVYEGMTFEEIACVTGVSATTSRERYGRALENLRKLLEA